MAVINKCAIIFSIFFGASVFAVTATAIEISVIGPCQEDPLFQTVTALKTESLPVGKAETLGDLTVRVFEQSKIRFQGDRTGIRSIFDSPVGEEALEILSDREMRTYGWCVTVDGHQPDQMPDQVHLSSSHQKVVWFYAYATYSNGVWKDLCKPSYELKSLKICKPNP